MRLVLLFIVGLSGLAIACSPASGETAITTSEPAGLEATVAAPSEHLAITLWSAEAVVDEIASQIFDEASRPVHIFGLNVEAGEEFVPSGRDVLPVPPDTSGWTAEFEGDGVWIVDTGKLLYRFVEADAGFTVIYEYATE